MRLQRLTFLVWIVGGLLLIGTGVAAGWLLNRSSGIGTSHTTQKSPSASTAGGITAVGYVDVEQGIAKLYPQQLGQVRFVIAEGTPVDKDKQLLLQIDDRLAVQKQKQAEQAIKQAEARVAEAKIALAVAAAVLEEAEIYPKQYQAKIRQQQALVEAAEKEQNTVLDRYNRARQYLRDKVELDKAQNWYRKVAARTIAEQETLKALQLEQPDLKVKQAKLDVEHKTKLIQQAELDVAYKKQLLEQAKLIVQQHRIEAPFAGTVLRVHTRVGEVLGPNPSLPAIEFLPAKAKIVRAEVLQEWATTIEVDQPCLIHDDIAPGLKPWKGRVKRISDWFTKRRSPILEPFQFNDVRTLECIIAVTESPNQPLRIGQRMRVWIKQGGLNSP